jgi:hypothetical protein
VKTIIIYTVVLLFILCRGHSLDACSCIEPPPPKEALTNADCVFIGTVERHEIFDSSSYRRNSMDYFIRYYFAVERIWKGAPRKEITVSSAAKGTMCGFLFTDGQKYIVYAGKGYYDSTQLFTSICSRTKFISAAAEDIKDLGVGIRVQ